MLDEENVAAVGPEFFLFCSFESELRLAEAG